MNTTTNTAVIEDQLKKKKVVGSPLAVLQAKHQIIRNGKMSAVFGNRLDSEEYDEYMNKGNEDREETVSLLTEHYYNILKDIGEDPGRQGLLKTPERAAKAFRYYTCGYNINLQGMFV